MSFAQIWSIVLWLRRTKGAIKTKSSSLTPPAFVRRVCVCVRAVYVFKSDVGCYCEREGRGDAESFGDDTQPMDMDVGNKICSDSRHADLNSFTISRAVEPRAHQ